MFGLNRSNKAVFWKELNSEELVKELVENSKKKTVILFKHSTRCSISSMAKNRFESSYDDIISPVDVYLLDLLSFRNVSSFIEDFLKIEHQSPQVIVLKDGGVIHSASHNDIRGEVIAEAIANYQ